MKKTMIYLDDVDHAALKRKAAQEGTSMAELIRRAVKDVVKPAEPDYFGFVGIAESAPEYGGTISEHVPEHLAEIMRERDPHE